MATALEASGQYQVLKRFEAISQYHSHPASPAENALHKVCIIDTETTGLDTSKCEIIELGYQIIEFDSEGRFYQVLTSRNYLNEPDGEISAEVTQVTGLTQKDVAGHHIPWVDVANELASVSLFVAHNAAFDRKILERYHDLFIDTVWGCSAAQVDWFHLAQVSSRSQEFLCWKVGHFFYGAHRALDDVQALTHLLQQPISSAQQPAFHFLLTSVRQQKFVCKATGAPFDLKDELKTRRYRWNADERVWQKILDASDLEAEQAWLESNNVQPTVIKIKATDTFSIRAE